MCGQWMDHGATEGRDILKCEFVHLSHGFYQLGQAKKTMLNCLSNIRYTSTYVLFIHIRNVYVIMMNRDFIEKSVNQMCPFYQPQDVVEDMATYISGFGTAGLDEHFIGLDALHRYAGKNFETEIIAVLF